MLCGWRTHSEIQLTGVPTSVNDPGTLDVMIQVGIGHSPIGNSTGRFVFQHSAECSLIRIEDVADFEVRGGREIHVWPAAGAAQKDIEIYLFGFAWACLCHQRGVLPLHASAIVTGNGITAFTGHSGSGKSTTAAILNSLGYNLIADDILPVSFNQNSIPGAWPFLRRLKLRRDPIVELAFTPGEMVSERLDKERYFVLPKCAGDDKWRNLERLYLLDNDANDRCVTIEQITGADAVRALVDQTYHFNFIMSTRRFGDHLDFCTRLAANVLIYRLRRSPLRDAGTKIGSLIRAHIEGARRSNPVLQTA
jgi:hypothetical protein